MPNIQVKLRRGTTAQHAGFTGAEGEVTVDTDKETLVVHDNATAGGHELRRKDDTIAGSEIDNGAVDTLQLADDAVTADKVDFPTAIAHARFFGNVGTGTLAQEIAANTVTWVYGFSAIVSTATTGLYTLTFSSARASGDSYTVVLGREFTSPTTDSIVVRNRTANGFDLHCSHTTSLSTVGLNVVVVG